MDGTLTLKFNKSEVDYLFYVDSTNLNSEETKQAISELVGVTLLDKFSGDTITLEISKFEQKNDTIMMHLKYPNPGRISKWSQPD